MSDEFDKITGSSFSQLEQVVGQDAYNTRVELEKSQIELSAAMKRRHETVTNAIVLIAFVGLLFAILGLVKFAMWVF